MAKNTSGKIHLLVSDIIMPGMNGCVLAKKIKTIRPDIKVIFLSGYTADILSSHGDMDAGGHFLQKPVPYETLCRKVREVLDAR